MYRSVIIQNKYSINRYEITNTKNS